MDLLVGSVRRLSESRNKSRSLPLYTKGQPPTLNLAAFQDDGISIASGKSFKSKIKRKRQSLCLPLPSSSNHSSSGDEEFDAIGTSNSDTSCSSVEFLRVPPRIKPRETLEGKSTQSLPSASDTPCPTLQPSLTTTNDQALSKEYLNHINNVKGSSDSLRRKERIEALKSKIAADRERIKDSSSEEETPLDINKNQKMWKFKSDETLHRPCARTAANKSRAARTERYLKRKSQDDTSLKNVSRSDPNLDFLDYSSPSWLKVEVQPATAPATYGTASPVFVAESRNDFTPSPVNPKSSLSWQESYVYEEPKRVSDVSGYHSQVETYKVPSAPMHPFQSTPKSSSIIRSGFSGPFFPSTRKPSPLTVTTTSGSPIHMAHPSPCDSGLSSQSMASSPSLGRAPTPPPRTKGAGSGDSGIPSSSVNSSKVHRPASCALSTMSTGSDSLYGRVINQSPVLTLPSECTSSGRSSPCWIRSVKANPNGNKLPPPSPIKNNSIKPSFYQYTDVPPFRSTSPVVYSYTDQAPTFRPTDNHLSAYMSDSQIDSTRRLPNAIRSVFNYQRKLATPPATSPIPVLGNIDTNCNGADVLSDSSSSRTSTWNSTSSGNTTKTPPPAIAKRPLSMVLEKSELLENGNGISNRNQPILRNGLKKSPPPVTPRKHFPITPEPIRTVNGSAFKSNERKNSSSNYEDALQELEDIYQSLGLNDEDLLDRAERRDIPTPQQFKRFSIADPMGAGTNGFPLARSSSDSVPSPGRSPWPFGVQLRTAPPLRRSAVPDKVNDDLANRRLQRTPSIPKSPSSSDPIMSYLQCSPALTPGLTVETFFKGTPGKIEPDVELDDVTYRKYTQAESGRVPPPHPPFGIPLTPVTMSSANDYLHAIPTHEEKPVKQYCKPPQEPDVIRDDMAFRNLRRDRKFSLGADGALDAACRETEVWPRMSNGVTKKDRAQRSLSANVESTLGADLVAGLTETERAQSMTDLIAELERESRKWESFAQGTDVEDDAIKKKDLHGSSTETLTEGKANGHVNPIFQPPKSKAEPKNKGAIYSLMSLSDIKKRKPEPNSCESAGTSSARDSRSRSPPPVPRRTSMFVLPKRPPHHLDFWSDTEVKHSTPFDDGHLDDLLASLSGRQERPSSVGRDVKGSTNGHASVLENEAFKKSPMIHFPSSACSQQNVTLQTNKPYSQSAQLPNFEKPSLAMTDATQRPAVANFSTKSLASSCSLNESAISRFGGRSRAFTSEAAKLNSPISVTTSPSEMPSGYTSASNERIAKLKEERRKQMQARFSEASLKNEVASGDILGSESSFLRRSLRLSKRNYANDHAPETNKDPPSNESACESAFSSGNSSVIPSRRRFITREQSDAESSVPAVPAAPAGIVRSTRASRLRAQATSSLLSSNLPKSVVVENLSRQDSFRKNLSDSDTSSRASAVDANENITQSVPSQVANNESDPSSEQGASGADMVMPKDPARVKDKSSKRKSNLNRANFLDEPRPIPSEANEASRRTRRTRRTSESSQTSSLDRSEAAFVRTGSLRVNETSSRFKKSSSDSPNASLKREFERSTRLNRNASPINVKLDEEPLIIPTPRKNNVALKKPDIPEILRNRLNSSVESLGSPEPPRQRLTTPSPDAIRSRLNTSSPEPPRLRLNTSFDSPPAAFNSKLNDVPIATVTKESSPTKSLLRQFAVENSETIDIETSRCIFDSPNSDNSPAARITSDSPAEEYSLAGLLDNSNDEIFGTPPETPIRGLSVSPTHSKEVETTQSCDNKSVITSTEFKEFNSICNTDEKKIVVDYSSFKSTSDIQLKILPLVQSEVNEIDVNFEEPEDFTSKQIYPILKRKSLDEDKLRDSLGIVRLPDDKRPTSILKKRGSSEEKELSDGFHPILKKHSFDEGSCSPVHSILKNRGSIDEGISVNLPFNKPILKKRCSYEELLLSDSQKNDPKPILKKKSSEDENEDKPKPILKSRRSFDESLANESSFGLGLDLGLARFIAENANQGGIRSILKKTEEDGDPEDSLPSFSILKSRSGNASNSFGPDFFSSTPVRKHRRNSEDFVSDSGLLNLIQSPKFSQRRSSADSQSVVTVTSSYRTNEQKNCFEVTERSSIVEEEFKVGIEVSKTVVTECLKKEVEVEKITTEAEKITTETIEPAKKGLRVSEGFAPGHSVRERFNRRNVPRYRTQPVTQVEVQQTDCLESVQAFRALIMKKTSLNIFDQLIKETPTPVVLQTIEVVATEPVKTASVDNKREYPQPYRAERKRKFDKKQDRRSNARYRTLPITLEELTEADKAERNAAAPAVTVQLEETSAEIEDKDRSSSSGSDELAKMSVSDKASMFLQKAEESRQTRRKSGVEVGFRKRYSLRSQTQPVTGEEVHEAAKLIKAEIVVKKPLDEPVSPAADPSKLSLADKMRLFTEAAEKSKELLKKPDKLTVNRRRSGGMSRFRTQPVTTDEVLKAGEKHRNGGLAASLKKPDEDINEDSLVVDEELKTKSIMKLTQSLTSDLKPNPVETPKVVVLPAPVIKLVTKSQPAVTKVAPSSSCSPSSEDSSSSSSAEDSEAEKDENKKNATNKTVLTGGQTHLIINPILPPASISPSSPVSNRKKQMNAAVQRKLNASLRHKEERRSLQSSQILETLSVIGNKTDQTTDIRRSNDEKDSQKGEIKTKMVLPHSRTLPSLIEKPLSDSPNSIKERLAALQKSGTEDWQKRIMQTKPTTEKVNPPLSKPRSKTLSDLQTGDDSQTSILDLKSRLEESQSQWRQRVEEKDAVNYTVAGKMANSSGTNLLSSPNTTPLLERKKKVPKPLAFVSNQASPSQKQLKNAVQILPAGIRALSKSKSTPEASKLLVSESSEEDEPDSNAAARGDSNKGLRVLVPKADNETFSSFFDSVQKSSSISRVEEKLEVSEDGFKEVTSHTHQLLVQKKHSVRMQKRHHVGSRNPIKALASRSDLSQEYTEVKTGIAEKEMKRIQVENLAKNTDNLALSALAGLASKEDFKSVALKKSGIQASPLIAHSNKMLVQVKGRRHVQTRLVQASAESVNTGDSYVLVTPDKVFCYMGEYSNIIERAKVAEIASTIQIKKDCGFKGSSDVVTIDNEKNPTPAQLQKYFDLLDGDTKNPQSAGPPDEDEVYEITIIGTNKVYSMDGDVLVPCKEAWGELPRIEMLTPDKVYVFDFGSELYVWMGKQVPLDRKRNATRLGKELWDHGYDYSECDMNPLCPKVEADGVKSFPLKSSSRPSWAMFVEVRQHMEPVLFREKFLDWPDMSRLIKVKSSEGGDENGKTEPAPELKAFDAKIMLSWIPQEPDLELEGSHLGRGHEYYDQLERRSYEIITISKAVWHILEYNHNQLLDESYGQFHAGDTYVVRWHYMIKQIGRDFQGKLSRHSFSGRNRCAYFFWQGKDSSITEKGASALMTVELDEERGPHVRVVQGKEPPCFLNLFKGHMIIYRGKREEEDTCTIGPWKLFVVCGEFPSEAVLIEVECCCKSLRSLKSFVLCNVTTGRIYLWHGAQSSTQTRETADKALEQLTKKRPQEMMFNSDLKIFEIVVIEEGKENVEFWKPFGGKKRKQYYTLLRSSLSFPRTPRLFQLSSTSGVFLATEIICSYFTTKHCCHLPFLQKELYGASQPALFILDNGAEVYLWQGWWPQGDEITENVATGSAAHRWALNRKFAMETTLQYCQEQNPNDPPKAFLTSAGCEPLYFTNLFPVWEEDERVADLNELKSSSNSALNLVKDILAKLQRQHFSLEELQAQPLPEGVDPSRLESYLSEEDFQEVLGVKKSDFYSIPNWKQVELKKKAQLF